MRYIPILFSTPMVKAIMDGSKTQTRRIIKPQPKHMNLECDGSFIFFNDGWGCPDCGGGHFDNSLKPKAQIDDVFWVRETFCEAGSFASDEFANSEVIAFKTKEAFFYEDNTPYWGLTGKKLDTEYWNWDKLKWKPSIFMPKAVCRTFLKVTNVRIETLHDISEEDAKAEGVISIKAHNDDSRILGYHDYMVKPKEGFNTLFSAKKSFFSLWESINGKASLDANPFTWVYDFEPIEKPHDFR